ncbi:hypothetical protein [Mesotoga sp.]|uniref:hypothetical protein n=1 Tax=Mesotoga sp. TaxID=2053577 RepID=UPI001BD56EAB|nr:hypothetical protein [Mesotoga sp.]
MNDEPRKQLLEIVKIFEIEVLEEPRILEGLLKDFCRNSKKEIFSIVIASKEEFVKQLTVNDNNENFPQYNKIVGLSHKLQENYGISEEISFWAVETI